MVTLKLQPPQMTGGSPEANIATLYSFLFQLVEQLNVELTGLEAQIRNDDRMSAQPVPVANEIAKQSKTLRQLIDDLEKKLSDDIRELSTSVSARINSNNTGPFQTLSGAAQTIWAGMRNGTVKVGRFTQTGIGVWAYVAYRNSANYSTMFAFSYNNTPRLINMSNGVTAVRDIQTTAST